MRVLHWCMLGVTILLLACEVTISQLCKSLITLVDGFHTLFILLRMALPPVDSSSSPPHAGSSSSAPPAPPPAESSIESPPGGLAGGLQASGVSLTSSRVQPVGSFISALLLTSLCLSYFMEILSFTLDPHPVQRPLLLVVVGAVSVLHKMLVVWLNWDQLQAEKAGPESHLEVNHKALAAEETKGRAEDGSHVQSAVNDSHHNGALVLCNPGTSSVPDTDCQTAPKTEVHLHAAAPEESWDCGAAQLKVNKCMGHLDKQTASDTSPVCKSSHPIERTLPISQWPVSLLSFVLVLQGLCTSLLALTNSLVVLLIVPQLLHSSGTCGLLVYLDPGLSLLAVIMLVVTALPQVHRYGLLLLQASPPHICVSDLGRRITSVPGVQAVHDLHVWQLTESFTVASVHVHCHAGFPVQRCADLMSGVTKVLQSVGVSCCTVQPEFASCPGSSAGSAGCASPVVHREDPSLPPLLSCSLACGKACDGNMCCSSLEESRILLAPAAGETKEEPQTLVIENTFL
ncbi:zinc/cadmium resistance protein [Trematomus bernacchii]|uniref:zinc/cadmium resistance protein n=1 Tax=Trematomus bernacchii TaxID=40690 RepID=UPI00146CE0F5|nr:zinc/cadmium resistance protein [Trematomus bernacchii]XP_033970835.1 zinc/cadmium resistance protein [Trematomus bernacchii]XP_033970836.1 zinc/cadmium resistance protein [Trematomus bernacchii]